ncbi:hypothetical protein N7455_004175 [Penicillium solitum]|uniref:uncharacterized protein n=1 Tax=Penicillium solitum TaxID=60172 RepID=UPI0032C3F405|nr:hypothetical protein N7536_001966 [Penicillium majusculum]KAJ5869234.1 hypothetical protein N7455_004175 [Penicillium solitum]
MRFPTSPLSSSREISNSSFSSFPLLPSPPFSYCSKISVSIFCLVYREFCFSSLVADYSFFASRISSVFPAFHARLFAWLRYDLISRRSFFNDSTKF